MTRFEQLKAHDIKEFCRQLVEMDLHNIGEYVCKGLCPKKCDGNAADFECTMSDAEVLEIYFKQEVD